MAEAHATFTIVLALAAGVIAQSLARHLRVPGIVLLLAAGVGLGPDGLGWVDPRTLGSDLFAIVDLAVAIILFEGGLNLELSRLRREQMAIRRLVTLGALVTLVGGTLAAHLFLGWGWSLALLFGSLVVVTGPTVIGPLVSELRLKQRPATVLEAEGVLIDPIGAILAVLVLELVISPTSDSFSQGGTVLLLRLGFGALAGASAGVFIAWVLRNRRLLPEGHENIFVLASVLLLLVGCDEILSHSGILAVTVAGVVVGNLETRVHRDLREFKDQLTVLLIGLLFVMLAADVRFETVSNLGAGGFAVLAALVIVVRPLGVALCSFGSELTWQERVFVGWIAPRGIVAAAVASLVAGALEMQNMPGGGELRAMVFLSIAGTVVLAGLTGGPVASWLGIRQPDRDTVAILSVQGLGVLLATELKAAGARVVFIDSNPQHCRRAEEAGFPVVFGSATRETILQRAGFYRVSTTVGLTANRELNGVFVARGKELFGVPKSLVAASQLTGGLVSEMVQAEQADVVFDGPHDVERWDVRERRGEVEVVHRVFHAPEADAEALEVEAPAVPAAPSERYVILSIFRDGKAFPMSMSLAPTNGDIASIAVYVPDRDEALEHLERAGWLHIDKAAETEETG